MDVSEHLQLPLSMQDLLSQESRLVERFISLLEQEQQLLFENAADRLQELVEAKSVVATDLAASSTARDRALEHMGFAQGRMGMEAWLETQDGLPARTEWSSLLVMAAEARALNELNGQLIRTRMQSNNKALSVLLAAANEAATYGPDGQQRSGQNPRSLGSA